MSLGKVPLKIHCHRADDIATAIRITDEFNVKFTLDHVTQVGVDKVSKLDIADPPGSLATLLVFPGVPRAFRPLRGMHCWCCWFRFGWQGHKPEITKLLGDRRAQCLVGPILTGCSKAEVNHRAETTAGEWAIRCLEL